VSGHIGKKCKPKNLALLKAREAICVLEHVKTKGAVDILNIEGLLS